MAWDWLSSLWDTIVDTTTDTLSGDSLWGDVATEALTTSVIGAGIGALVSAVSDGDIGEGLLYGATGGLVAGGLSEFGSKYFDNWTWSGSEDKYGTSSDPLNDLVGPDSPLSKMDVTELELATSTATKPTSTPTQRVVGGPQTTSWTDGIGDNSMAALLTIGGGLLQGFGDDPDMALVDEKKRQFDLAREDELAGKAKASGALKSFQVDEGGYEGGTSVAEQVQNRALTGFSKEDAGVDYRG